MEDPQSSLTLGTSDAVVALVLAIAGLLVCGWRTVLPMGGWFATALWLLSLPVLGHLVHQRWQASVWDFSPLWKRWERWGPSLLVTVVVLIALWPLPLGEMPISQDHANHYLATHIFVNDFLSQGQLFGWSDRISSGLPFGDVYGTLVYTVTGALSFLSFGLIPLSTSYALGIVFVWWLTAMAVVAWTRRLSPGVWPAVLAGCLLVLDPGGDREGGWNYAMFHGVWPQLLATGLGLWALLGLYRLSEQQTWRRLSVAALLVGLALWAHPMNAITLLLGSVLLVLLLGLERLDDKASEVSLHRGALWCVVALAVGGAIGWAWLSRLFVAAPEMKKFSATWKSLHDMMLHTLQGRLFAHSIVFFGILSILGAVALWRQRRREGQWALAFASVLLVLGSAELILAVDGGAHPHSTLFMFRRVSVALKPFWYMFAGLGLVVVLRGVGSISSGPPSWRMSRVALVVFLAPVVWNVAVALPQLLPSPTLRPLTAKNAKLATSLEVLRSAMRAERQRFPKRSLRMVQWRGGMGSYELLLVADENWAYLPTATPPCQALKHINAFPNDNVLRWLGATHLLSHVPRKLPHTTLVTKAGRFHLYRITTPPSRSYFLRGIRGFQVVKWKPSHRVFRVSGVSPKSRLVVGVPPYRKWQFKQQGEWKNVRVYRRGGYAFAVLQPLQDGLVTFAYRDTPGERVALGVGLTLLLLCLLGAWWGRAPLPLLFPGWLIRWVGPLAVLVLVGGGVGLGMQGWQIQRTALEHEFGEKAFPRLVDVLHHPSVVTYDVAPKPLCVRPFDRDPHPRCSERFFYPKRASAPVRGQRMPTCMKFGVPHRGKSELSFSISPQAKLLKGRLHGLEKHAERFFVIQGKVHKIKNQRVFRIPIPPQTSKVKLVVANFGHIRSVCLELVTLRNAQP